MCGGSEKQRKAHNEGKPFTLAASTDSAGIAFYEKYVAEEVVRQWNDLLHFNPEQAARMLAETPPEYRCVHRNSSQTFAGPLGSVPLCAAAADGLAVPCECLGSRKKSW